MNSVVGALEVWAVQVAEVYHLTDKNSNTKLILES